MVKLSGVLNRLQPVRVLVLGDFMVDTYTTGKIKRISPEAPVSVLHVHHEEARPGGAGNVVLNLLSLGASVVAVGRVGLDHSGRELKAILEKEGADVSYLLTQGDYQTPIKNRLIADAQQVLRVDFEIERPVSQEIETTILTHLPQLIAPADVIAISDYGKGFLSPTLLRHVIELAKKQGIPVIVDPKGEDFSKYLGATIIKPNVNEAYAAAKEMEGTPLSQVAATLLLRTQAEMLVVTRSELGISLFDALGHQWDFPVRSKEVKDVTGAGDTVLAMMSVALGNRLEMRYTMQLSNIAAGLAIERLGCARIQLAEVAERLLEYDVENKIFDEEHLFALQKTLQGKKLTVLAIDSHMGMTTQLFRALKRLSNPSQDQKLILYIKETSPSEEFIALLASLAEVHFIILKCDSLKHLCDEIHPGAVWILEQGELIPLEHPLALFARLSS